MTISEVLFQIEIAKKKSSKWLIISEDLSDETIKELRNHGYQIDDNNEFENHFHFISWEII